MIDAVAEQVQILADGIDNRDLGRRDDLDPMFLPGGERFVGPGERVMVAERCELHAGLGGLGDHVGGNQRSVGMDRM